MGPHPAPPGCTVADWSDARRRARLRASRLGARWGRFGSVRRGAARLGLVVVAPPLVLCGQYWALDVAPERERLAGTHPVIHHVHDAASPVNRRTAVVDMVGLGNLNASETARALPSLARLGQVWAVQYDNTGVDTAVISRLVADRADAAGVRRVVLVGHSMGGILALEVAQHLHEGSALVVDAVVLDCTPVDLHAVRPESRDAGEDLLRWMGWVPGARESRSLRFAVETAARRDGYLSWGPSGWPSVDREAFRGAVFQVLQDKIWNDDAASNGLIESQFQAIVASGADDNVNALGRAADGKPAPAVVLLRPRHAADDPVVDVDRTQRTLFNRVARESGDLLVVRMAHTGHANPIERPTEYNRAVEERVAPYVERRMRAEWTRMLATAR